MVLHTDRSPVIMLCHLHGFSYNQSTLYVAKAPLKKGACFGPRRKVNCVWLQPPVSSNGSSELTGFFTIGNTLRLCAG
eukprot:m.167425 g.167425  ORF g.167425 m.167425 type:complete len:78 (+) comp38930_c1_seq1:1431-1664(+)